MGFIIVFCLRVAGGARKTYTFSLLIKKPNFKNPCGFLDRFEHAKVLFLLTVNIVPCRIFRRISF